MPKSNLTLEQRFWKKVNTEGPVHSLLGTRCWTWTASKTSDGYGTFNANRVRILAHRFSWILKYGLIRDRLFVLHRCDNPPCVNPDHLFAGTQADNIRDCYAKGRRIKDACIHGHPYNDRNTKWAIHYGVPRRFCRVCRNARVKAKRHQMKGSKPVL